VSLVANLFRLELNRASVHARSPPHSHRLALDTGACTRTNQFAGSKGGVYDFKSFGNKRTCPSEAPPAYDRLEPPRIHSPPRPPGPQPLHLHPFSRIGRSAGLLG
jgi:hypothetical protein